MARAGRFEPSDWLASTMRSLAVYMHANLILANAAYLKQFMQVILFGKRLFINFETKRNIEVGICDKPGE